MGTAQIIVGAFSCCEKPLERSITASTKMKYALQTCCPRWHGSYMPTLTKCTASFQSIKATIFIFHSACEYRLKGEGENKFLAKRENCVLGVFRLKHQCVTGPRSGFLINNAH